MKKSIVKSLSAFFALVLIFSVLPMAAFATETEEYEHAGDCCSVSAVASCAHPISTISIHEAYQNLGNTHYFERYTRHVCTDCGFSWDVLDYSGVENHQYFKVEVKDSNGNVIATVERCGCGAVKG